MQDADHQPRSAAAAARDREAAAGARAGVELAAVQAHALVHADEAVAAAR